jgi:hypothetical protein
VHVSYILLKGVTCYFAYLIGLDVQLLLMQVDCRRGNDNRDITLQSENIFPCVSLNVKYSVRKSV